MYTNSTKKLALIGAGISNLTLLNLLNKNKNLQITLFERSKVIGGRVATRNRQGFLFDNGANYLHIINKPIKIFDKNFYILSENEIIDEKNSVSNSIKDFYYSINSKTYSNYTYSNGIKNIADLLIQNSNITKHGLKFSKNITRIKPNLNKLQENLKNKNDLKFNYTWNLFSEENENLGEFDKVIFGMPSLNISRILDKSKINELDFQSLIKDNLELNESNWNLEKLFFKKCQQELSDCTYRKTYSLAVAYNSSDFKDNFNDYFGLVNYDKKSIISSIFIENEKNRKNLNDKKVILFIIQFFETETLMNLNIDTDKDTIFDLINKDLNFK